MEDYYKILGINKKSSKEEIKQAYRKLQLNNHPDKNNNSLSSIETTQKINEAYSVLSDEKKKKEYDLLNKHNSQERQERQERQETQDIFKEFFGKRGYNDPFLNETLPNIFNMMNNDLHNIHFFHNNIPININKPLPIMKKITINMIQVLEGCIIPVEIERWIIQNDTKIFEQEVLYINIPKSIDQGEMIILKDKGNSINEIIKGDIKIMIDIVNDTKFVRDGLNLIYHKTLTLKESLCGFSFELEYINKKIFTLNNHTGNIISPNYQKVIPNLGLERDNYKGNLIIIFNIEFPSSLNEQQIKILNDTL
jgi:DnaJ-class molecular chaperone